MHAGTEEFSTAAYASTDREKSDDLIAAQVAAAVNAAGPRPYGQRLTELPNPLGYAIIQN